MSVTIKRRDRYTIASNEAIMVRRRPSDSDKAITLLIKCLDENNLIVKNPTDSKYATVETQVYKLISNDVARYGKASSSSMGAQRAYNLLYEAQLIAD